MKTCAGRLLVVLLLSGSLFQATTARAIGQEEKKPETPLTLDGMLQMLHAGVGTVDILIETQLRRLDFVVDAQALNQLAAAGAEPQLLNRISVDSLPLIQRYVDAIEHYQDRRFGRAVEVASGLIKDSPRHLHAYWLKARSHYELGALEDAARDFSAIYRFDENYRMESTLSGTPVDADGHSVRIWLGQTHLRRRDYVTAIKLLNETIETPLLFTSTTEFNLRGVALRVRGWTYLERGSYQEALADLTAAIKFDPKNPAAYAQLAMLLAACPDPNVRNPKAAIDTATTARQLAGDEERRAESLDALAAAQAAAGNFEAARELELQAIGLAGDFLKSAYSERLDLYKSNRPFRLPVPEGAEGRIVANIVEELFEKMIPIEGGSFKMGSLGFNDNEKPVHEVNVAPFLLSKHEVTNRDWALVTGLPLVGAPDEPKDFVSWHECREFVGRLNRMLGPDVQIFRLPTEAEWEYAARSGTATDYFFGNDPRQLRDYAWYLENADGRLNPVGQLKPNEWGLYDLYGNVAEWVQDPYADYPENGAAPDPVADEDVDFRVFRGGSRTMSANYCRSAARSFAPPLDRRKGLGFRLAANEVADLDAIVVQNVNLPPQGIDRAIDELRRSVQAEAFVGQRAIKQDRLKQLFYIRAFGRFEQNNHQGAADDFREVLALAAQPNEPFALSARCLLAWVLATSADDKVRDGQMALEFSRGANGVAAFKQWLPYTSLAAAHAELGEFDKAVQRAQQSLDQAPPEYKDDCERRLAMYQKRQSVRGEILPLRLNVDESK